MWKKCRDVSEGEDTVKNNREYYLPKPSGMSKDDYEAYITRAEFFNATGRTLEGIHGLVFRKKPIIEVPDKYKEYLENVDGKGTNIYLFLSEVCKEILIDGWGGLFLDAPNASEIKTKSEAIKQGIFPYMKYYKAQDIYNWHYSDIGRSKQLDRVCLHEEYEVNDGDDFTFVKKDRYRLLSLDENNLYKQEIVNQEGGYDLGDYYPKKNNKPFNKICFRTIPRVQPTKPMLLDLVNLNLAWYRKSADLENGAHWTGVPTPYVLGYEPEVEYYIDDTTGETKEKSRKSIYLGGTQMLTFPQGVTGIGYLEFVGAGLSQLQRMMEQDEMRMAILGARIISAEKKGVEAVETARIHRASENSVIANLTNELNDIFKDYIIDYLSWCTEEEINSDDITVKLNTDYDLGKMTPSELTALVSLWQSGGISKKVLFDNLKEGEIISNDLIFDDMEKDITLEEETKNNV